MYAYGMNIRILRDPGSEGGGGSAAGGASGGSAGAPASQQGAAGTGYQGGAASEYVSKADFDSFSQRITEHLSRSSSRSEREPEDRGGSRDSKAPKFPSPSDYDFKKPGEFERFENDKFEYFEHRRTEKQTQAERERAEKEAPVKASREHFTRLKDYRKEHPEYDEDMRKAGAVEVLDNVKHAVYSSKNSPAVVHFLAKNREAAAELNFIAESEGLEAVRERIGEISATIRAEAKLAEATAKAANARPPRQSMRGPVADSKSNRSKEEIFASYHNS